MVIGSPSSISQRVVYVLDPWRWSFLVLSCFTKSSETALLGASALTVLDAQTYFATNSPLNVLKMVSLIETSLGYPLSYYIN